MSFPDPIAVFRTEAAELLEQIEAGLLDLNVNLGDKDQVDTVFRSLHTLKGSGAMFGFDALAAFTHHCETAFDRVRKGEVPATHDLVGAVLEAKDHMRLLVDTPAGDHDAASEALLANLRRAVDGAGMPEAPADPITTRYTIRFSLPQDAMANGTNPLGLLDELRDLGDCRVVADRSAIPPLDQLNPVDLHLSWTVELTTSEPRSAIDDVFIFVMDDMQLEVTEVQGEPQTSAAPAEAVVAATDPAATTPKPAAKGPATVDAKAAKAAENVRVPAERLDELMDRVGELVIAQSRLSQLAGGSGDLQLRAVSEDVERLSGELRDTMMVLRMVPVTQLFSRFRRLVHDLANETGKVIELVTEGETTEVDKSVIERLADPMIHLVRNSCDHGLETAEQRLPERSRFPPASRVAR